MVNDERKNNMKSSTLVLIVLITKIIIFVATIIAWVYLGFRDWKLGLALYIIFIGNNTALEKKNRSFLHTGGERRINL